jgi:hypothetical protein
VRALLVAFLNALEIALLCCRLLKLLIVVPEVLQLESNNLNLLFGLDGQYECHSHFSFGHRYVCKPQGWLICLALAGQRCA